MCAQSHPGVVGYDDEACPMYHTPGGIDPKARSRIFLSSMHIKILDPC